MSQHRTIAEEVSTGKQAQRKRVKGDALSVTLVESMDAGEKFLDGKQSLPGGGRLMVRARKAPGGVLRDYYFRYRCFDRSSGKYADKAIHLGSHGSGAGRLSLAAAREKAREQSLLLKEGKDPQSQRTIARNAAMAAQKDALERFEEERRLGTFRDLLDAYVAHLRSQGKPIARDVERSFAKHVYTKDLGHLADLPAKEIKPDHISDILVRMIARKIERRSNIVRSYLSAAFSYAARAEHDPLLRAQATERAGKRYGVLSNPVALVPRQKSFDRAKDRVLSDDELRAYLGALKDDSTCHPSINLALEVALLLGGQRLSQLLRAKWEDYDPDERLLRLVDGKGRGSPRVHVLPVSEAVAELLARLRALNEDGAYIFSADRGRKPLHLSTVSSRGIAIGKAAADKEARPFSAADLRRTAETRLASLGVSKEHRAQVLSHGRDSGVQARHYDRHDYLQEKAAALAKWELHLQGVRNRTAATVIRARFGAR